MLTSLGRCLSCGFDTFFATGHTQAADTGLSFGVGLILGFAVGNLCPRFSPKRVSLPQTALRLHPRRRAICAALIPVAQSCSSSATSFVSQPMSDTITSTAKYRLVPFRLAYSGGCRHGPFSSCLGVMRTSHQSLDKNSPVTRQIQRAGSTKSQAILSGLHHH